MTANTTQARLDQLATHWNEAEIPRLSLDRWLAQFEADDHSIALRLLECIEMHSWARLLRECRLLHQRLCRDLAGDGFDVAGFRDIDFTRAFVCKSGDLIAYAYRKANRLPVTCFRSMETLLAHPPADQDRRALVVLDDYIGTGSQFLFHFLARQPTHLKLLQRYAKVRLAAIVVHDDARHKWKLLQHRCFRDVMAIEEQELACIDFSAERESLVTALSQLDWSDCGLLAAQKDFPITAHPDLSKDERVALQHFLRKQQQKEGSGTTEFLLGHHSFFYGAPNALARVLLPLFKRVEDFTAYDSSTLVGLPAAIIDYNIDNSQAVSYLS